MKARYALATVAVLFACLGAKSRDDGYVLNWKPKAGQHLDYQLSTDMKVEGSQITFMTDVSLKVTKLADNGDYTIETTRKNGRVVSEGEEHKIPETDDEKPEVETYNAKGEKISENTKKDPEEADEVSALLESVGDFNAPDHAVKKGDKWTEEIKADEKKKVKAAKVTYEVVGTDKIGAYDVVTLSMSYKQTEGSKPPSYEGTISFDVTDMSLVRIEASIMDVPFDEGTTGDMKLKMTRQ